MPPEAYKDPVVKRYVDLITSLNPTIKGIYFGDPIRIPRSNLPALIASKISTSSSPYTNAEDKHDMTIKFTIVTDIRKDLGDDVNMAPGVMQLYEMFEGKDPTTYLLKTNSLLYILRHNQDAFEDVQIITDISTPTKIDYGMTVGKRAEDGWAIEGSITINSSIIQLR